MSTAILISGQVRTLSACLPTQHWHVYRHFPDRHFFVLWQDSPEAKAGVALLEAKYGKEFVHAKLIADPTDLPMIPMEKGAFAPYANAASHPKLLMQHWYQNEVWKFYVASGPRDADEVIIRMRADNYFNSYVCPCPDGIPPATCYSPWWGRFGGINDRFALMDRKAAESYFTLYDKIDELMALGCPFHPESLLKGALDLGGVTSIDALRAEFSTWRIKGDHRAPEVMHIDIAHLHGH